MRPTAAYNVCACGMGYPDNDVKYFSCELDILPFVMIFKDVPINFFTQSVQLL